MSFQIIIFLYIYLGFLAVWSFFFIVAVYHMYKFGFKSIATFATTFLFIAIALIMLTASFIFIFDINWKQEVEILKFLQSNSLEEKIIE